MVKQFNVNLKFHFFSDKLITANCKTQELDNIFFAIQFRQITEIRKGLKEEKDLYS